MERVVVPAFPPCKNFSDEELTILSYFHKGKDVPGSTKKCNPNKGWGQLQLLT